MLLQTPVEATRGEDEDRKDVEDTINHGHVLRRLPSCQIAAAVTDAIMT